MEVSEFVFATILVLTVGVSFLLGSWLSPTSRAFREEAKHFRGLYGSLRKKETQEVQNESILDIILDNFGDQLPPELQGDGARAMIKQFAKDPENLKKMFSQQKPDEKEVKKELTTWN